MSDATIRTGCSIVDDVTALTKEPAGSGAPYPGGRIRDPAAETWPAGENSIGSASPVASRSHAANGKSFRPGLLGGQRPRLIGIANGALLTEKAALPSPGDRACPPASAWPGAKNKCVSASNDPPKVGRRPPRSSRGLRGPAVAPGVPLFVGDGDLRPGCRRQTRRRGNIGKPSSSHLHFKEPLSLPRHSCPIASSRPRQLIGTPSLHTEGLRVPRGQPQTKGSLARSPLRTGEGPSLSGTLNVPSWNRRCTMDKNRSQRPWNRQTAKTGKSGPI